MKKSQLRAAACQQNGYSVSFRHFLSRKREVLTSRFLLNLSIKATAVRMGMTVAHVKVLQFRALKRAADL
ncbi:MAG: hypothetical protein E6J33_11495 [Chloroflexi bacterium]|nr:MAG: hypothetical protein E6J33_11495 [Chloroflexota bacterium]